ncbi:MAG: hypothetical protein ACK6D3_04225 [Planctomycetaceae bacterium]
MNTQIHLLEGAAYAKRAMKLIKPRSLIALCYPAEVAAMQRLAERLIHDMQSASTFWHDRSDAINASTARTLRRDSRSLFEIAELVSAKRTHGSPHFALWAECYAVLRCVDDLTTTVEELCHA